VPQNPSTLPNQRLEDWLRYFEELGISTFYRDRASRPVLTDSSIAPESPMIVSEDSKKHLAPPGPSSFAAVRPSVAAASVPQTQPIAHGPSLFEAAERIENDTLERTSADLGDCTRCKLHRHRNRIVFGAGNPRAELVFVGEGPGHDEDMQGLPFVGRAGQLLTQMIQAMGITRDDVYICNVVKCRPPDNRTPERDEVAACMPFLLRQLATIQPKVIVCLGTVAAQALLGTNKSISHFRGQWLDFRGSRLMATYHPAYLLRNPNAKPEVWADLKKVMAELGLKPRPAASR